MCGNEYIDMEYVLFSDKEIKQTEYQHLYNLEGMFDAIWCIPQMSNTNFYYWKTLYRCPVYTVSSLNTLSSTVGSTSSTVTQLTSSLNTLSSTVSSTSSTVTLLTSSLNTLSSTVGSTSSTVTLLISSFNTLSSAVSSTNGTVTLLTSSLNTLSGSVTLLTSSLLVGFRNTANI